MLHSKRCATIAKALEFVNDNQNKVIPVSFVSIVSSDEIIVVYEAVDIPEPGTMQFDLLRDTQILLGTLIENDGIMYKKQVFLAIELKKQIDACLN